MEFRKTPPLITLKPTYTDTSFFVPEWKDPSKKTQTETKQYCSATNSPCYKHRKLEIQGGSKAPLPGQLGVTSWGG